MADVCLWRASLLGGFRLTCGTNVVADEAWRRRKAATLIKLLALTRGHRLHREQLMEMLWPDQTPASAANSLHQATYYARRAFASVHAGGARCLQFTDDYLNLCPDDSLWVDVEEFEQAARSAHSNPNIGEYELALALYTGDLLPEDLYEDWAAPRRTALRQTYLSLLTSLAELQEAGGAHGQAIETLQRVVAADTAHETAHRSLMRLYSLTGDRLQALRQYQALREALCRELDAEPDAASEALYRELLAGRELGDAHQAKTATRPDGSGPKNPAPASPPNNLPRFLTSFVGRDREVAELLRLLKPNRLVTLTGPGGCGKTRLALGVATHLLQDFPSGAWWVEFAALTEPSLAPRSVASVLRVSEEAGPTVAAAVANFIGEKPLMLVMDNCEHLVEACASLAQVLLAACPNLTIVATSRERLDVPGEVAWPVPPLALPDREHLPALPQLLDFAAVRLFCDRAAAARPGFELTPDDAAAVADICIPLDGLPLAIELAAARTRILTPRQIADGLADRFGFLTDGHRTSLPRHRTLRATMDWSYELLSEAERVLLRRLAVFRGSFTLQAAEAICDGTLEFLARLVDKSLVQVDASGGQARFALLETVQQYAAEKLGSSGEMEAVQDRHLLFYLGQAEEAEPWLKTGERGPWLGKLDAETGNLRAALAWGAKSEAATDAGLQLAMALVWFWYFKGYWRERTEWLARLLDSTRPVPANALLRARAMTVLGASPPNWQPKLLWKGAAIARSVGEAGRPVLTETLRQLMFVERNEETATRHIEESLALARAANSTWDIAQGLLDYGTWSYRKGDFAGARDRYAESLSFFYKLGDHGSASSVLNRLGQLEACEGDYPAARRHLDQASTITRQLNDPVGLAFALGYLGEVALAQGSYDEDARLLDECIPMFRDLGYIHCIAGCLCHRGVVAERLQEYDSSAKLLRDATLYLRAIDFTDGLIACLAAFASLALSLGQHLRCSRLLGAATGLVRSTGYNWHDHLAGRLTYEDVMRRAEPLSDRPGWKEAWEHGEAMTLQEAVAFALEERAPGDVQLSNVTLDVKPSSASAAFQASAGA